MRSSFLFALILVFALVAGACSDDGGSSPVASLETDTGDTSEESATNNGDLLVETEAALLAFTQCLRDQGFDVADPTIDADGNVQLPPIEFTSELGEGGPEEGVIDFEERLAPCEEHLEGVVMTGHAADTTGIEDTLLEYAQCMRSQGYDMPDPDFSSGNGIIDLGSADEEEFEAADAECRHLLSDLGLNF